MKTKAKERTMVRSNHLLYKKYTQYFIPTMITYAALSLNEFVDSMLVSNLLNTDAMAIVNLGMPLMLVVSATYMLLGSGGSTIYAIAMGSRDRETAGNSLTASTVAGLVAGLVICLFGAIFVSQLADVMCSVPELRAEFKKYLRILLISAPFEVAILTFVSFLPAAGYPDLSTAINVVANVINIIMDYVYIRHFHMGVSGAAWATLTGYICATLIVAATMLTGRTKFYISRSIPHSFREISEILRFGSPDAMNQIGLCIQIAVCNHLAMAAAGTDGVVAYSLCSQGSSVMSIFVAAIIGACVPILSILHGQRDYQGEASMLKTAMVSQFFVALAGTILFRVFAGQAATLYNITDPNEYALSVNAFKIFALVYIPRYAVLVYYNYPKILGKTIYSTILSALDSFVLLVPIAYIMVILKGINGLWWAYPLSAVILVIITLICNEVYRIKSKGRLRGPLLFEYDESAKPLLDVTITKDPEDISGISMKLQQACEENGLDKRKSMHAALAVEELALYASSNKKQSSHIDILVRLSQGNVEIDFRSLGEVFNPLEDSATDIQENVRLLRSIASKIDNEYMLGMNCTRITLKANS